MIAQVMCCCEEGNWRVVMNKNNPPRLRGENTFSDAAFAGMSVPPPDVKNAHCIRAAANVLNFHEASRRIFLFLTNELIRIFMPAEKCTKPSFAINKIYGARKIPDDLRERHGKNRP